MSRKTIKTSFNAGELSPLLDAREDMEKYYNGCARLENGTVLPYGGVVKRPGTKYIDTCKSSTAWSSTTEYNVGEIVVQDGTFYRCTAYHTAGTFSTDLTTNGYWVENRARVLSFQFSVSDNMIIEMGCNYFRFYKDDEVETITKASVNNWAINTDYSINDIVEDSVGGTGYYYCVSAHTSDGSLFSNDYPSEDYWVKLEESGDNLVYEIYHPYTGDEVFECHHVQSGDVIYFTQKDNPPQKLSRLADNSWTMEDIDVQGGPFLTENTDTSVTLKFTPSTGTYVGQADDSGGGSHSTTVLVDTGQSWTADALIGYRLYKGDDEEYQYISDNDATTITTASAFSTAWADGDYYIITDRHGRLIEDTSGTLTATGGSTPFVTTHVGSKWRLQVTRDDARKETADNESGDPPENTDAGILIKGDFEYSVKNFSNDTSELYRRVGEQDWQVVRKFTAATSYSGTEELDDVAYTFIHSSGDPDGTLDAKNNTYNGIVEITAHSSGSEVTAKAVQNCYIRADAIGASGGFYIETSFWAEGAWSDYRGYPSTITFYEDRLWLGGSTNNPQRLWGSVSSDYENFETGTDGDDSVQIDLNPTSGGDVSSIEWLAAREVLFAGTGTTEFRISASNPENPITPTDIKARDKSYYGSNGLQPRVLNNALFFAQGSGRKLRAMRFELATEQYDARDANMLHNQILEDLAVDMAVQKIPDAILWVVRGDGQLLSFTYEPSEEVWAWARHITKTSSYTANSWFRSVCSIRGSNEDEVYAVVERIIDGTRARYIEKFSTRFFDSQNDAVMVDSAVILEAASSAIDIVYAADTVIYGAGAYGSGPYGS